MSDTTSPNPVDRLVGAVQDYMEEEDCVVECAPDEVGRESLRRDLRRARRELGERLAEVERWRQAAGPFRRVLVAVDGSAQAGWAADAAGAIARDLGARVTLLHVLAPPIGVAGELGYVPPPVGETRRSAEAMLREARSRFPAGVEVDEVVYDDGDPAVRIVAAAEGVGADLIVIGRHARGPLARLILGSTADAVVRRAPCAVLTISHPADARPARHAEAAEDLAHA